MNKKVIHKTLDEIKKEIIDKLDDINTNPAVVTRAHEYMFGSTIPHAQGVNAPDNKFAVNYYF